MSGDTGEPEQKRFESVFAASTENVELFIVALHQFLAERGLAALAFDMELLAREALVNAVVHGCACAPAGSVRASVSVENGAVALRVCDDGPGWNWRSGLPGESPAPASEHGRGLFIISKYSDFFTYNDSGNALTILKRLPQEDQPMQSTADSPERMTLGRRVSAQDVPQLREDLRARIQAGARRLVLDFSQVESLDSMGIGLLAATHNSLAKLGGSLSLVGVRRDIHQLLLLMRLDKQFSIAASDSGV